MPTRRLLRKLLVLFLGACIAFLNEPVPDEYHAGCNVILDLDWVRELPEDEVLRPMAVLENVDIQITGDLVAEHDELGESTMRLDDDAVIYAIPRGERLEGPCPTKTVKSSGWYCRECTPAGNSD